MEHRNTFPVQHENGLSQAVFADLLYARLERNSGYIGRSAQDVLADMDRILTDMDHCQNSDSR